MGPLVNGEGADGRLSCVTGEIPLDGEGKLLRRSRGTGRNMSTVSGWGGNRNFLASDGCTKEVGADRTV